MAQFPAHQQQLAYTTYVVAHPTMAPLTYPSTPLVRPGQPLVPSVPQSQTRAAGDSELATLLKTVISNQDKHYQRLCSRIGRINARLEELEKRIPAVAKESQGKSVETVRSRSVSRSGSLSRSDSLSSSRQEEALECDFCGSNAIYRDGLCGNCYDDQ